MKKIENDLIDKMIERKKAAVNYKWEDEKKYKKEIKDLLEREPFETFTADFFNHPTLKDYINPYDKVFNFWILMGKYVISANDPMLEKEIFSLIEKEFEEVKKQTSKKDGGGLLPEHIANPKLIRNVYLSNNAKLITLFSKFLSIPKSKIFEGYTVPEIISAREQEETKGILKFLEKNNWNLSSTEDKVIKLQRQFRAKKRFKEEIERLTEKYIKDSGEKITAEQLLSDANSPYMPQGCDKKLAMRIFNAAKKVTLFSTIKHLASVAVLPSILDDGLYGRRTLLQSHLDFRPAALNPDDVGNGDGNVICCGPSEIDPNCLQENTVEITLDLKKIQKNNPCVFYKQLDLGYALEKTREISIGKEEILYFSHTKPYGYRPGYNDLRLFNDNCNKDNSIKNIRGYSQLPSYLFIAYDFKKMHQILTLNFFRFIDNLKTTQPEKNESLIKELYAHINKLDDEKLVEFLQELGTKMTDTAEFNFYGAHKIDLSSILTITYHYEAAHSGSKRIPPYTLHLPAFISELQSGNLEALKEAKKNIPTLFKSYRFLDYLLSKTNHETIKMELQKDRNTCAIPSWMKAMHDAKTSSKDGKTNGKEEEKQSPKPTKKP